MTNRSGGRKPAHRAALSAAFLALAAACWFLLAARGQDRDAAFRHDAPAAQQPGNAPQPGMAAPSGTAAQPGGTAQPGNGASELPPGGLGQGHGPSLGAQPGPHDAATNESKGEEKEEISIHVPTWITGLLKQFWYRGPATLNGGGAVWEDGTPVNGADVKGKTADFTFVDHHAEIKPKPEYPIHPVIGTIGSMRAAPGAETATATVDGRTMTVSNPEVAFAYQGMFPEALVLSLLTAIGIAIAMLLITRNLQRVPGRLQTVIEWGYEALDAFVHGLVGPHYRRYVPLVGTSFIYILIMSLGCLLPGGASPTANLNVTAGMAVVVIVFVQYEGIRVNGILGYLRHFVGEPWWLFAINFPIHAIGEVARVLSLSVRLFGNIFGEDVVLVILIALTGMFTRGWMPIQTPMFILVIFTSVVQAFVFSMLTCVYLALMTTHEEGDHGHEAHGHEHREVGDTHMPAPAV